MVTDGEAKPTKIDETLFLEPKIETVSVRCIVTGGCKLGEIILFDAVDPCFTVGRCNCCGKEYKSK